MAGARVAGLSVLVGAGLVTLVWVDYAATRRELVRVLRDQAASVRQIVAAAARANREASRQAEAQLTARLLDNARLLAELDSGRLLSETRLEDIAKRNGLYRVNVFGPDGTIELERWPGANLSGGTAAEGIAGRGRGGGRRGPGLGFGGGLVERILAGEEEAVGALHEARSGLGSRVVAAVRRPRGGAIVLNVDASTVATLQRRLSLDVLLADIVKSAPEIAYVVFEHEGQTLVHGLTPPPTVRAAASESEREVTVAERPVLELLGPVSLDPNIGSAATLRLGMRLDGVRGAERRMLLLVALSLAASVALAVMGVGAVWLRRKYALLSEEHSRAEEALRRRDRLAAMGELAASVAHEVRNPLNAIAMSAQRLRREVLEPAFPAPSPERDDAEELVRVVEEESRRINGTVQRFLEFARPPRLAPRRTSFGALAQSAAEAVRAMAEARGVSVVVETDQAGEASVDPDQLRQAVDNILRNAIEATPQGGIVRVAATSSPREHVLTIEDGGQGIPAELVPRIFDLYYTTKPDGTGIGLAVTQQIVTAHGGTIEVASVPGEGTRMAIRIPAAPLGGSGA
jgi:signal transduction histidine kinase